jgi:tetratricopeptide (TPR) repeat protein
MIAKAYLGVGNISRAISHANDAFSRYEKSEHVEKRFLVDIGSIYFSCNELEQAEKLLLHAEKMGIEEISDSDMAQIQTLKGAIELKKMNLSKAEENLLQAQVTAVAMNYSDIMIQVMIHLSEISILRYNITGNSNDLVKAEERTADLESLIRTLNLPRELCKILLIKAKIAKNQFQIDQAIHLANELIQIASKHEYNELIDDGKKFIQEINEFFKKKNKKKTKKKITSDDLSEMVRSLGSRRFKEEKSDIYALIIIQPEGTPLFTIDFSDKLETDVQNSLLLSGFLRAVTDLSSGLFKSSKKAFLRAIEYIDATIIIEIEQNVIFSLLVEKETLELRFKLRQLIKDISSEPDFMVYKPKIDPLLKNTILTKVRSNFKSFLKT